MVARLKLKIGTLSTELRDDTMQVSRSDRISAIVTVVRDRDPDVLLTAGYALDIDADRADLERHLKPVGWDGLLIVEVHHSEGKPLQKSWEIAASGNRAVTHHHLSGHCLFAWERKTGWKTLGRQFFATRDDAENLKTTVVASFQDQLSKRVVHHRGMKIGALICGELNALQGRDNVKGITPEIENWLDTLDIVVNPTHDRMGNGGTLLKKREWLSRVDRIYISASNWNTKKKTSKGKYIKQTRSKTLHTVFVDGSRQEMNRPYEKHHSCEYFEYREAVCQSRILLKNPKVKPPLNYGIF